MSTKIVNGPDIHSQALDFALDSARKPDGGQCADGKLGLVYANHNNTGKPTSVAAASIVDASIDPRSLAGRLLDLGPIYVRWWGDSIGENVGNPEGNSPGARGTFFKSAYEAGYNVRPLGTRHTGLLPAATAGAKRYGPGLGRNECKSGDTIAQMTARVATAVAAEYARTGKKAHVEFFMGGTNAGGNTAAQSLADASTFIDTLRAANPDCWIVVRTIPLIPTNAAYRNAVNAGLPAVVASKDERVLFSDACGDFTNAEMGVVAGPAVDSHPSMTGQRQIGLRDFATFRNLFPYPNGMRSPRAIASTPAQYSLNLTETNTQVYWPSNTASVHTTFGDAVAGHKAFLAAIDFAPASLSAAARAILAYGNYASNTGWLVGGNGAVASIYAPGSGGAFSSGYGVFTAATWGRLWLHYDLAEMMLSLVATPNGQPAIVAQGAFGSAPSWAANDYILIGGYSAGVPAYAGNYRHFELCVGDDVPVLDDLLDACRANYFEHAPLPGRTNFVPFNESSGSAVTASLDACGDFPATSVYGAGAGRTSVATTYDG